MDYARKLITRLSDRGYLQLNFYRLHLGYFVLTLILSSVIVYGSGVNRNSDDEEAKFRLRYIDALFLCTSAMTNTGLNTVSLGSVTAFQQAVLAILILLGNVTIVSTATVYVRRHFFQKHMKDFLAHSEAGRHLVDDIDVEHKRTDGDPNRKGKTASAGLRMRRTNVNAQQLKSSSTGVPSNHHETGHGGFPYPWETRLVRNLGSKISASGPGDGVEHHYLSFQPSLDSKVILYDPT